MSEGDSSSARPTVRARAFAVHIFTALGAGFALMALLEAVRSHWTAMFFWLGAALVIDAIDGSLARRLRVAEVLPNWSGDTLDLVVDFTTYVFVPAYAIAASGFLVPHLAPFLGVAIVVSGALYFADLRMKTDDNHFRGFPTLWNVAAFFLFLLRPSPWVASLAIAFLVIATFLPINVMHPIRVKRFRFFNIALVMIGAALSVIVLIRNFDVPVAITIVLCLIAIHVTLSDLIIRLVRKERS
ncbi:CDP-alcohol phosphatidyltransferase family protein [Bradyrhizobium sp. LHD-71]|uniref:CDP-alcohol phosphatidyltransferase family protein n=1 Tax=Bradyrhizobium sp. LHD-71 TaxID=3072141 RepID=UPI00280E4FD4|nr:CDP-alcohol phosphatidyltransferase family protein [Bradyrhizobium sp. LHD-71]MDQ8728904.1 CDP-alcohol phosphatidyltransferase family protein [Bradyrhizobium sp. LHD-71]